MPPNPLMQMIMSLLAGAGFKSVAEGMSKLSQSGNDPTTIFSLPQMPLFLAGAGIKDVGNSMDLVNPLMKAFAPPQPPPDQPKPEQMNAAMQMLSARLGPGLSGIQTPQTMNPETQRF